MAATQKKESALDDLEQTDMKQGSRGPQRREAGERRPDWRREEDGLRPDRRREAG